MKREVKIGIFAVLILGCSWAGIRFLSGVDIFRRHAVYYAAYDRINGVQTASAILVKGVKVGTVTDIRFDPARSDKVVLQLTVKYKYPIPENSSARIFSDGLMGSKAIEITLGDSPVMLESGDTIPAEQGRDLMDVAGSELEFVKQKISQVTGDLSRTLENLNRLVEANADNVTGMMGRLNSISGSVDEILTAEKLDLQRAIANLAEFTEMLGRNAGQMDSVVRNVNRFTGDLAESDVAGQLAATLTELNAALEKINDGDGTLARFMNDDRLYASLDRASANLASLLADLQAHPKRYVHFSLFGRSEKKERREQVREAERARRDSVEAAR